jgi:aminoacrylate hydrolase
MRYDLHADAGPDAPAVLLSSGLGGHAAFWQPQLAALTAHRRVLTYDHRGTGCNPAELSDGYTIADMAADVLEILDAAGIAATDFVGHALGGLVGLELARTHPDRIRRLVVVNGWARADPATRRCFASRIELLLKSGIPAYIHAQPIFLYPAWWLSAHAERIAKDETHMLAAFPGIPNTLRRIAALQAFDIQAELPGIRAPTLLAAAVDDTLVPYTCSEVLHAGLPNAQLALVERGGHAFTVTDTARFNRVLLDFLQPAG